MHIVLHQIIGDSVLGFTPEDCVTFKIQLKTKLKIVSIGDVLTRVLKDNIVNQLSDKLGVVHIFSLVLLGVVDDIVINHARFKVKLWLHHIRFT